MHDSVKALELLMSDFNQFVSDGASNAIGSIAEFESQTREERSNDISVQRCVSHNNELSLGYASGLLDYTDRVNEELGDILKKLHTSQVRLSRSGNRMLVYRAIQEKKGRNPALVPVPGNDTRWNSRQVEVGRFLMTEGDQLETSMQLFSKGGDDYDLLTDKEKKASDLSRFIISDHEKMVLRQWEASAMLAKYFSKFTQDRRNTQAYLLLEIQMVLDLANRDYFEMHNGKSVISMIQHKSNYSYPTQCC